MAIARLKLDTERAKLKGRKAVAKATLASSSQRLHELSRTTPTPPTSPKSSRSALSPSPACGAHHQPQRSPPNSKCWNAVTNNAARINAARTNNSARTTAARMINAEWTSRVARTNAAKNAGRTVRPLSGRPGDARLAHAHQVAPLRVPPHTVTSDPGFKSNKAFDTVPLFSSADSQSLRLWTDEFLAQAEIVAIRGRRS